VFNCLFVFIYLYSMVLSGKIIFMNIKCNAIIANSCFGVLNNKLDRLNGKNKDIILSSQAILQFIIHNATNIFFEL
jgi:hypothetical protein